MNINDAYDMPTADGDPGFVLTTNGGGNATWSATVMLRGRWYLFCMSI